MIKLFLFVLSLLNLCMWFTSENSMVSISGLLPLISIIISCISIIDISSGKIRFRLIYILIAGILVFNSSWYFTYLFNPSGMNEIFHKMGIEYPSFMKTNYLLGVSLPLISLGYLLNNKINITAPKSRQDSIPIRALVLVSFALLCISISITGLTIGSLFIGVSSYWYMLLIRFVTLTSCAFAYSYLHDFPVNISIRSYFSRYKLYTLLIFLYVVYLLIGGDRGPVLVVLIITMLMWVLSKNNKLDIVNTIGLIICVSAGISLFQTISNLRGNEMGTEFNFNNISTYAETQDNEHNLGSSQFCTYLAINYVDNGTIPHTYGLFFISSLVQSIPFIGSELLNSIGIADFFQGGTAQLLTELHYGRSPTSGLGTTYLADMYIEFGICGVVIISLLFGIFIRYLDVLLNNKNALSFQMFTLIMFFAGYSFYTGRANIYTFLVNYVHAMCLYYIVFKILLLGIFSRK